MTLREFKEKVREIMPDARFDRAKNGEVIILSGLEPEESNRPDRDNREMVANPIVAMNRITRDFF
jgi:hypothetical protein